MSRTHAHRPAKYIEGVDVEDPGTVYYRINMPHTWWIKVGIKHYNEQWLKRWEYSHTPKWSRIMNRAKRKRDAQRDITEWMED